MDNEKTTITFSHYDFVDILQIVNTTEAAERQRETVDCEEIEMLTTVKFELLSNLKNTKEGCIIKFEEGLRLATWLCLDKYRQFCIATNENEELAHCEKMMYWLSHASDKERN